MKKNFMEVNKQGIVFNFETLGTNEKLNIVFNRTLRIPDDNKKYGLPPGIGTFPVEHVEDYAKNLPESWAEHGGVFFPMYQAEAMWMRFHSASGRPFAIKVASGKVNAVSGKEWKNELVAEKKQPSNGRIVEALLNNLKNAVEPDYMVAPKQPWLDGFNVGKGVIRQFVAVPLESGYTVEEQVTGKAEVGGVQIMVYPMKEEVWQAILKKREEEAKKYRGRGMGMSGASLEMCAAPMAASASLSKGVLRSAKPDMGLGAGGMMTQEIFADEYGIDAWDQEQGMRVFVHLANSEQYKEITGKNPPTEPPTPELYRHNNYPWFNYYDDGAVVSGSEVLSKVDSIGSMQEKKNEKILPDDGHKPSQPLIALGTKTVKNGKWEIIEH
jgi:hypothetical protein